MNERLKKLRKALGYTQEEFGKMLEMTQQAYGMLETGYRPIIERHIKMICAIFGVNEEWLRNGTGEMFVATNESIIDELAKRYNFKETERVILETYLSLPEEYRAVIMSFFEEFSKSLASGGSPAGQTTWMAARDKYANLDNGELPDLSKFDDEGGDL